MTADEFIKKHGAQMKVGVSEKSFACPVCHSHYKTVDKMMACFNRPPQRGPFKVGEIVLIPAAYFSADAYGVRDLSDPWLAAIRPAMPKSPSHFDHHRQAIPWFVIADLRQKEHREVATVITLASARPNFGWTPTVDDTHDEMFPIEGVLSGDFQSNQIWREHFKDTTFRAPGKRLKSEAAKLAAAGLATDHLLCSYNPISGCVTKSSRLDARSSRPPTWRLSVSLSLLVRWPWISSSRKRMRASQRGLSAVHSSSWMTATSPRPSRLSDDAQAQTVPLLRDATRGRPG